MKQKWNPAARPLPTSAWADIYPEMWAAMANGKQPMTPDDYQTMTAYYHMALLDVRAGNASDEAWTCLALGANLSLILAEQGYGAEWMPVIVEAQAALERARDRGRKTGAYRMDGAGIAAMGETLSVLDSQLEIATRNEILAARDVVMQRMAEQEAEQEEAKQDAEMKL